MKITNTVLDVLGNCRVEENILYLPANLDRKVYTDVNKILEALGGKWNRKAGGHVFDHYPADEIDEVILTGEYTDKKKEFQFFPTPPEVAEKLCDFAGINENTTVLEPSCGKGNIADAVWKRTPKRLLGIELNTDMAQYLDGKPYEVITGQDFLQYDGEQWDRIVMNPPFSRQQDIDHVMKAYSLLEPYIEYFHIKDAIAKEVVPAGKGDGNVGEILSLAFQKGYNGFLSLEPHLTHFIGLDNLENEKIDIKPLKDGAEAYTLAYKSLMELL